MAADRSVKRMILILAVSGFASTSAGRSIEPLVGVMARDLQSDPRTVALLSAAFALPYAFIQPILGPVGDAFGKERMMPLCLGVLALAMLAGALTPNLPLLFALRVLAGMAAGGVIPMSMAMIGDRVGMETRQIAISRFLAAVILGQLAGSSVAGLLAEAVGWRGVFGVAFVMTAAAALGAVLAFGRPPPPEAGFDVGVALARYRKVFAIPRARALYAFVFVDGLAFFGLFPYIAPTIEARGEGGPFEAGLVLAGFAAGGLVYAALVAWMLRTLGVGRMLVTGGLLSAGAFVGLGLGHGWQFDAALLGALGVGFYMLHNSYQTQITEVLPEARASAIAFHAFSFFIGQALGVVLVGASLGAVGWTGTAFLCAAAATALGLVSAWYLVWKPGTGASR
jgi:predicted MFS family arabinose efflux permease